MKNALLLLSLFAGSALAADTPAVVTREATGEAAIVGGDVGRATKEATAAALRQAVEQVAGVMIQADSVTRNSVLVKDEIASRAQGFVKHYEVTSKAQERGVMKVTVKADVLGGEIDKDLQAVRSIVSRLNGTKLLVITQESLIDTKGISTRGEMLSTHLNNVFRNDGWRIIDEKGTFDGKDSKMTLSAGVSPKELAEKVVANKFDVDYIVYGEIKLRYVPPNPDPQLTVKEVDPDTHKQLLFFVEGEYDLSMMETRTGRNLAKVAGKLAMAPEGRRSMLVGYEAAAKDLCERQAPSIASKLRAPVMEYLRDQVVNGADVELKVSGLPDFSSADEIQRELSAISKVKAVKMNDDFADGTVTYSVHVDGTASDLGRALDKAKVLKSRKTLKTTAVRNNRVEVAIAK